MGALALICGLYCWITFAAFHPELPQETNPLLLYSNQSRQDLRITLSSALKKAQKSIYLSIYALTDPGIIELLNEKSRQGIAIQILYDPSASTNLRSLLEPAIDAQPAKTSGLMHRKITVIDEKILFLGSANMTPQSLSLHDNLTLGAYHPELAHFLTHPTSIQHTFSLDGHQAELWMLPDQTGAALESLVQLIATAKKTLSVAMFTLTHPTLIQALIQAHKRGVNVKCAVDYYTGQGASLKALESLKAAGISIYLSRGSQLLHHKWAYIDEEALVLGSANWTHAAFWRNHDCFIILKSLHSKQKKFMTDLWQTLELECELWNP